MILVRDLKWMWDLSCLVWVRKVVNKEQNALDMSIKEMMICKAKGKGQSWELNVKNLCSFISFWVSFVLAFPVSGCRITVNKSRDVGAHPRNES